MNQTYIVYVVLAVVFAVALLFIWRASKKRRAPIAPPEEQRPTLEAVPPVAEKPAVAKPPVEKGKDQKGGREKPRGGFAARTGALTGKKQTAAPLVGELKKIFSTADIGAKTAHKLFESVKGSLSRNEL